MTETIWVTVRLTVRVTTAGAPLPSGLPSEWRPRWLLVRRRCADSWPALRPALPALTLRWLRLRRAPELARRPLCVLLAVCFLEAIGVELEVDERLVELALDPSSRLDEPPEPLPEELLSRPPPWPEPERGESLVPEGLGVPLAVRGVVVVVGLPDPEPLVSPPPVVVV